MVIWTFNINLVIIIQMYTMLQSTRKVCWLFLAQLPLFLVGFPKESSWYASDFNLYDPSSQRPPQICPCGYDLCDREARVWEAEGVAKGRKGEFPLCCNPFPRALTSASPQELRLPTVPASRRAKPSTTLSQSKPRTAASPSSLRRGHRQESCNHGWPETCNPRGLRSGHFLPLI